MSHHFYNNSFLAFVPFSSLLPLTGTHLDITFWLLAFSFCIHTLTHFNKYNNIKTLHRIPNHFSFLLSSFPSSFSSLPPPVHLLFLFSLPLPHLSSTSTDCQTLCCITRKPCTAYSFTLSEKFSFPPFRISLNPSSPSRPFFPSHSFSFASSTTFNIYLYVYVSSLYPRLCPLLCLWMSVLATTRAPKLSLPKVDILILFPYQVYRFLKALFKLMPPCPFKLLRPTLSCLL